MIEDLRPNVRATSGYVPGEQPREGNVVKLNTNENPYPPSPRVIEAIRAALTSDHLRKYPDPMGTRFRQAAGRVLDVDPDGIVIGNGSDDVLTILTRAFVPEGGCIVSPSPSYLLYRTLAELQGARFETVPFLPSWELPSPWPFREQALTFLANPNSPSGSTIRHQDVERLADEVRGPLVVDEAYADFAEENCLSFARSGRVIVTRTFSKFYSLAGIRFGFAVTTPQLARELVKVKDSYNCDVLSLAAATAALEDQSYVQGVRARILATRARLETALSDMGFMVTPSQANFVWVQQEQSVRPIFEALKRQGILVRFMQYPEIGEGLRITVGTDDETDQLLQALRSLT